MKTLLVILTLVMTTSTSWAQGHREVVAVQGPMGLEGIPVEAPLSSEVEAGVAGGSVTTDPECPEGKACVPVEDMALIVQIIRERQCLEQTDPEYVFSDVTIVIDSEGRIFYQGDTEDLTTPFVLQMEWCHYRVLAGGPIKVNAAVKEPPVFGFRFRPKAYLGYALLTPMFDGNSFDNGIDAGLMLDFMHYKFVNLNVAVGFRTLGGGFGVDITNNFGGYLGYGLTWKALIDPRQMPLHNFVLGFSFAF